MPYEVIVKDVDATPVVSIRTQCHAAEIGAVLQQVLGEVWRFLDKQGVQPAGPPFTRYHGFQDSRVDLEGGMPVAKKVQGEGRVAMSELPGGTVVTTVHMGPYEKLPEAHDALHVWMRQQNKKAAGPQWEYYWTDPGEEPDPSKRKTELVWPIRDA